MSGEWVLSVSQLNEYVRLKLSGDPMLRAMRVQGEISGFKRAVSGHLYFTLKDEGARVQCVMFRQSAMGLSLSLQDGMSVIVTASASLYAASGSYQLYVDAVEAQGVGDLYQRFEKLKQKLQAEGLFDPSLKRPLPEMPVTVGVVTSRTGAVLRDIVRVSRRRNPRVNILLAPASVQGPGAAAEIVSALELLNRSGACDVILCGRGGGSIEELWPFNEEIVARAIRRSAVPVVSCVGHETDFTIADFAADLRAPTPSAAAELAVPLVSARAGEIDALRERAEASMRALVRLRKAELNRLRAPLAPQNLRRTLIGPHAAALDTLITRLDAAGRHALERKAHEWTLAERALASLDPGAVLQRGYAVVEQGGRAQSDILPLRGAVTLRLRDGRRQAMLADPDAPAGQPSPDSPDETPTAREVP